MYKKIINKLKKKNNASKSYYKSYHEPKLLFVDYVPLEITRCKKLIEMDPNDIDNYIQIIKYYEAYNNIDEAIKYCFKLIEINRCNIENYYIYIADLYQLSKNYKEAIKYYDKSIEINPDNVRCYINNAEYYERQYESLFASIYFCKAFETMINYKDHYLNTKEFSEINLLYDEAFNYYKRCIKTISDFNINSDDKSIIDSIFTYIENKNYNKALEIHNSYNFYDNIVKTMEKSIRRQEEFDNMILEQVKDLKKQYEYSNDDEKHIINDRILKTLLRREPRAMNDDITRRRFTHNASLK